jgi:hypothetical protein
MDGVAILLSLPLGQVFYGDDRPTTFSKASIASLNIFISTLAISVSCRCQKLDRGVLLARLVAGAKNRIRPLSCVDTAQIRQLRACNSAVRLAPQACAPVQLRIDYKSGELGQRHCGGSAPYA